ncbi:MAG: putative toxin-antitoxin system toxin component, PIN family [Planctomycetota bacterium]|jgi:putative PIN family toxin of toxin-antitoxin system
MLITVDTNVMYQALRSSLGASYRIMQLVRAGSCRLALSQPVFTEYEGVLTRPSSLNAFGLRRKEAVSFLRYVAYISEKFDPRFLLRPNLRDEDDNMFVELAFVSQSTYLITSNTKDFVSGDLRFDSFQLRTPSAFITMWRSYHE